MTLKNDITNAFKQIEILEKSRDTSINRAHDIYQKDAKIHLDKIESVLLDLDESIKEIARKKQEKIDPSKLEHDPTVHWVGKGSGFYVRYGHRPEVNNAVSVSWDELDLKEEIFTQEVRSEDGRVIQILGTDRDISVTLTHTSRPWDSTTLVFKGSSYEFHATDYLQRVHNVALLLKRSKVSFRIGELIQNLDFEKLPPEVKSSIHLHVDTHKEVPVFHILLSPNDTGVGIVISELGDWTGFFFTDTKRAGLAYWYRTFDASSAKALVLLNEQLEKEDSYA